MMRGNGNDRTVKRARSSGKQTESSKKTFCNNNGKKQRNITHDRAWKELESRRDREKEGNPS